MDEKDRLGDKLRDKQRAEEDRYFKERERAALEKLKQQQAGQGDAALREGAKGRCPKDGDKLNAVETDGIVIDQCPTCRGIWLDDGELEALSAKENESWIGRFFRRGIEKTR